MKHNQFIPKDHTGPIRLHLGCQSEYFEGYINIDLPADAQTVETVRADINADVRDLVYDAGTVDEVRSHHLLEHFSRAEALVLLARWHKWLKVGGKIVVETPDFEESARKFLHASFDDQCKLGRHIFGSQEAAWAVHREYWYEKKYKFILERLGFGNIVCEKFSNNLEKKVPLARHLHARTVEKVLKPLESMGFNVLPNIICTAEKIRPAEDYEKIIEDILARSMVGSETEMIKVWMQEVRGKI
jgi:predicted SAM-dependent methyltransferase